eukprot:6177818-Pleurochrysis_carterae.AAC.5
MINPMLFISFCLCVSVSTSIFSAWSCVAYTEARLAATVLHGLHIFALCNGEYFVDSFAGTTRSFLREDPSIECGTVRLALAPAAVFLFADETSTILAESGKEALMEL